MPSLKYKDNNIWNNLTVVRGPKGDNADVLINGQMRPNPSFYAPEQSGTVGQILVSMGSNTSPSWSNLAMVATTGNYNDLSNKPITEPPTSDIISGSTAVFTSGGAYTAFAQRGLPAGGTAGQVLRKNSSNSYDASWTDFENAVKAVILADNKLKYPIGKIIIETSNTNPATYLGFGSWESYGQGKVLVGVDTSDSNFNTVGKEGGAPAVALEVAHLASHTHIQNSHNHSQNPHGHNHRRALNSSSGGGVYGGNSTGDNWVGWDTWIGNTTATNIATTATNQSTGGGQAHNNLQPYITVYMWRRIA